MIDSIEVENQNQHLGKIVLGQLKACPEVLIVMHNLSFVMWIPILIYQSSMLD